jgi:hypothetical protein
MSFGPDRVEAITVDSYGTFADTDSVEREGGGAALL